MQGKDWTGSGCFYLGSAEYCHPHKTGCGESDLCNDLLGLLSPIMLKYKLLLQKFSSLFGGWDDELSEELRKEGKSFLVEMFLAKIYFCMSNKPEGVRSQMEWV